MTVYAVGIDTRIRVEMDDDGIPDEREIVNYAAQEFITQLEVDEGVLEWQIEEE